jgi:hypothetical protein
MQRIESDTAGLPEKRALTQRQKMIAEIDKQGLLATPANSYINELVVEAARLSIVRDGAWVDIRYEPKPHVAPRG